MWRPGVAISIPKCQSIEITHSSEWTQKHFRLFGKRNTFLSPCRQNRDLSLFDPPAGMAYFNAIACGASGRANPAHKDFPMAAHDATVTTPTGPARPGISSARSSTRTTAPANGAAGSIPAFRPSPTATSTSATPSPSASIRPGQGIRGQCNLRFDDTNPAKEEVEYVDAIQADVRWLGFDWEDRCFYASNYFGKLYALPSSSSRRAWPMWTTSPRRKSGPIGAR
jgi:hypothetical protein